VRAARLICTRQKTQVPDEGNQRLAYPTCQEDERYSLHLRTDGEGSRKRRGKEHSKIQDIAHLEISVVGAEEVESVVDEEDLKHRSTIIKDKTTRSVQQSSRTRQLEGVYPWQAASITSCCPRIKATEKINQRISI
jgi:hypothetical protein